MHDAALADDLLDRAIAAAGTTRLREITLQIGALAPTSADHLRLTLEERARTRWGRAPELSISKSGDPVDKGALGVTLVSVVV